MATPRKTPQDRKPKAAAFYTFQGVDGKTYSLPDPTPHVEAAYTALTGAEHEAIVMGDTQAEMKLGALVVREAVGGTPEHDALRALPAAEYLETVGEWMQKAAPGE